MDSPDPSHAAHTVTFTPKLTEVADEALEVDEELHVGDEEAVDFGHVGDVLHE